MYQEVRPGGREISPEAYLREMPVVLGSHGGPATCGCVHTTPSEGIRRPLEGARP